MIGSGVSLLQRFYRKGLKRECQKWVSQRKTDDSFCRNVEEGKRVLAEMATNNLVR
jgi:hypothetical protein